jgi:hypothetical protein
MSIHVLKGILDANHVNARLVLEKSELVDKVWNLIEVEKRERERERAIHEAEEQEMIRRRQEMLETLRRQQAEREAGTAASNDGPNGDARANDTEPEEKGGEQEEEEEESDAAPPKPTGTFTLDRDGLCVVCQDEEANIAIVDCGYVPFCLHYPCLTSSSQTPSALYGMLRNYHEVVQGMSSLSNTDCHREKIAAYIQDLRVMGGWVWSFICCLPAPNVL